MGARRFREPLIPTAQGPRPAYEPPVRQDQAAYQPPVSQDKDEEFRQYLRQKAAESEAKRDAYMQGRGSNLRPGTNRPFTTQPNENYVRETRQQAMKAFLEKAGVQGRADDEQNNVRVPNVSSMRMAGDFASSLSNPFADELNPSKSVSDELEKLRYGVSGPTKTQSPYTSFLGG